MRKDVFVALFLLSVLLALMVAQKINLTTADLGRHIKNGEVMLNAGDIGISRNDLLKTNLYSYTEPNTRFVNHHWGSGVLFYIIFTMFGWAGLSLFHVLLFVGAFTLFFLLSAKKLPLLYLVPLSLFLLPIIGDRTEIRPETISVLFIAIFIYILTTHPARTRLYLLPLLMLLWANLHIYFVFGLFIISAFLIEQLVRKDFARAKSIGLVLILSILASFITPFGPQALLYPFTIFGNYGYKLVENQSISFLENIGFAKPIFLWWKVAVGATLLATIWTLWRHPRKFPIALGIITLTFGILSFLAIRNFSIFGLVLLPYLSFLIANGVCGEKTSRTATDILVASSVLVSIILLIIIPVRFSNRMPWHPSWGLGLLPGVNASAEFVEANEIDGPIFSNYDIGGYLIFHKFPEEKVFVDNRPEAYSVPFFEETYVPMQEKQEVWSKELEEYNFNTIWFYRHDLTPWAQQFLIARVQDTNWAPIFVDDYTIILLRRTPENSSMIMEYELPKELFGIH